MWGAKSGGGKWRRGKWGEKSGMRKVGEKNGAWKMGRGKWGKKSGARKQVWLESWREMWDMKSGARKVGRET